MVVKQFVTEGQVITAGAPIYQIDVSKSTHSGVVSDNQRRDINSQQARIAQIISRLESSKQATLTMLEKQKAQYTAAFSRSTVILERAQEGIRIAKENMENYRHYQTKGLINKDQLTNQVALYYQQHNNLLSLSGQNEQNALQITALESRIQTQAAEFDNQIYQMELQRYELQKELLNIDAGGAIVIRALADGRVDSLSVTVGQMVNIGDSLLQLLPKISNTMLWCFGCPTTPSLTLPPEIRSMCAMTPFRRKNLASSPAPCPSSPKPRPHRRKCGPIRGPKSGTDRRRAVLQGDCHAGETGHCLRR